MYLTGEQLQDHIIRFRRDLHAHPELGGQEYRTSRKVQEELERLGIPYESGFAGTGILGIIEGAEPGPTVALRADMDALPVVENTASEYRSQVEGVMHACGHDAHTAMLIGAAHSLKAAASRMKGKVLLIFQPAEEVAPIGGAEPMLRDGLFAKHRPDVMLAQHVWPKLPVGTFGIRPGYMMGASDQFELVIKGRGGHASMPHEGVDAIVAAGQFVSAAQSIVSRSINPLEQAVVTIGTLNAGYRYNALAEEAHMTGTIRTFNEEVRKKVEERLRAIAAGISEAMDVTIELTIEYGYPSTCNDQETALFCRDVLVQAYGPQACPDVNPSLAAEDFSKFLKEYKGVYYWLGVGGDNGDYPALHDSRFILDERALRIGYEAMTRMTLAYMDKNQIASTGDEVNDYRSA